MDPIQVRIHWNRLLFVWLLPLFAGCAGLSELQNGLSQFDQGAHEVSTAQMGFFHQVQVADCNNQFYGAAFNFATKQSDILNLAATCEPTLLTTKQIELRQKLMDSLTLYADKLQALGTSDANKTLDSNSQDLAKNLDMFAKTQGLSAAGLEIADGVEAAIAAIAEMALDERRYSDIKTAAAGMGPHIRKIVDALKQENMIFAEGLGSKVDQIQIQLRSALLAARQKQDARSFIDVLAAREIVRSINPLGASPISVSAGSADPKLDPRNVAKQLNASLDALVNANNALATAGTGGFIAAVNDLVARGKHANDLFTSLNK